MNQFYDEDIVGGPVCPFTRNHKTGSHPTVETYEHGTRVIQFCRHCLAEVSNLPAGVKLEEPLLDKDILHE